MENTPKKRKWGAGFAIEGLSRSACSASDFFAVAAVLATPARAVQRHDAETLGALYSRAFDPTQGLTQVMGWRSLATQLGLHALNQGSRSVWMAAAGWAQTADAAQPRAPPCGLTGVGLTRSIAAGGAFRSRMRSGKTPS
jgi:hypothetical protein